MHRMQLSRADQVGGRGGRWRVNRMRPYLSISYCIILGFQKRWQNIKFEKLAYSVDSAAPRVGPMKYSQIKFN